MKFYTRADLAQAQVQAEHREGRERRQEGGGDGAIVGGYLRRHLGLHPPGTI